MMKFIEIKNIAFKCVKSIKYASCLTILLSLFACGEKAVLGEPIVKCGKSIVLGQLVLADEIPPNTTVSIIVMNPITMGSTSYNITLDKHGKFKKEIETELNLALAAVYFSTNPYQTFMIPVVTDGESNLQVIYKEEGNLNQITLLSEYTLPNYDIEEGYNILNRYFVAEMGKDALPPFYHQTVTEFVDNADSRINSQLENIEGKLNKLSPNIRMIDEEDARIMEVCWTYFNYVDRMEVDYPNAASPKKLNHEDNKTAEDSVKNNTLPLEYYSFLKILNLDSPLYLYASSTPMLFENLLSNTTINIPPIGDYAVSEWLEIAKQKLLPLMGEADELFYNVLVCNAYARQMINIGKSLSDVQISNIENYFNGNEFQKILFRQNEKI